MGNCFYIYRLTPYVVSMTICGSPWYLGLLVPLVNQISMYFQWQMLWHLVSLVKNPLHLGFGLNKLSSINFWVKFYFYYLSVPGWWNDVIIIWQIVLKWLLQRGCSFSVIVEPVCSIAAPAVFLTVCVFLIFEKFNCVISSVTIWTIDIVLLLMNFFVKIYNKSVWTILKAAFLMFVLAVATNEFVRDTIIIIIIIIQ